MAFSAPDYSSIYKSILTPTAGATDPYSQIGTSLSAYYQRLLDMEHGDVERAKQRLVQDYQRGMRISNEDFTRNMAFGQESAAAAKTEQGLDAESERRRLEADMLRRGVSQGGMAETEYGRLKTRQDLRREAIDRALRKSEEDLKYGKERSQEEETLKQTRGDVDLTKGYEKTILEKNQEKQEKALGLTEQAYNREFAKRSTEEGFRLSEASLAK